jgi:hypothetical protein
MNEVVFNVGDLDALQNQLIAKGYANNDGTWNMNKLNKCLQYQGEDIKNMKIVNWCPSHQSLDDCNYNTWSTPMEVPISEYQKNGDPFPMIREDGDLIHGKIYTANIHLLLEYTLDENGNRTTEDSYTGLGTTKIIIPIRFRYRESNPANSTP